MTSRTNIPTATRLSREMVFIPASRAVHPHASRRNDKLPHPLIQIHTRHGRTHRSHRAVSPPVVAEKRHCANIRGWYANGHSVIGPVHPGSITRRDTDSGPRCDNHPGSKGSVHAASLSWNSIVPCHHRFQQRVGHPSPYCAKGFSKCSTG